MLGLGLVRDASEQYKISLKAAAKRNEPNYGAHAGLGNAYFFLGRYRLAIQEYNRAIGIRPNAIQPLFQLANATYLNDPNDPAANEILQGLVNSSLKRVGCLALTNLAYMLFERTNVPEDKAALAEGVSYLEEAYQKDPYAYSSFRLGIARALQGNAKQAVELWKASDSLPWGPDPFGKAIYQDLIAALLGDSAGLERLRGITEQLQQQAAVGLLYAPLREMTFIERSHLFNQQVNPIIALLSDAMEKARQVR